MTPARSFASDNNAGVHPDVMSALAAANVGHVPGYGDDPWTRALARACGKHFGAGAALFPVFNGTGANVLSLKSLVRPHQSVLCAAGAHIDVDECGAPEAWTGCKLIPIATADGKLTPALLARACHGIGDQHHVQPHVISISQSTELGTVYRSAEVRALARFAHARGMVLHMDGARIANAAASQRLTLRQATRDLGVDVLSFGGTKNGLMGADAVVLFDRTLVASFKYVRKQGTQLASKMRFLSAQIVALLKDDLWQQNARHANQMARLLASRLATLAGVKIVYPVNANAVFAVMPRQAITRLRARHFFYTWDEEASIVRWMCSWDTTPEDVSAFAIDVTREVARHVRLRPTKRPRPKTAPRGGRGAR